MSFVYSLLAQVPHWSLVAQEGDNSEFKVQLSAILVEGVRQCLSTMLYSPLLLALNADLVNMDHADQAC